ncbi:DMT family transporter [Evansella clarkii]|uniref:DMT family transporter n=1 Tax=Evansella clarkii TaxID=79879 RepID=UPI000B442063|nr:DMT family transporter [Evansella clarkii]
MKKGVILNILSLLIMSLSPLINKFSLGYFEPMTAALFNSIFASIFCFLYGLVIKEKIEFIKDKYIWLIGFTNAVGLICLFLSLSFLSPVTVGFLGRFYIIFAIILAVVMLKEKFMKVDVALIVTAVIGTFLFVEKGSELNSYLGIAFALLYTFLFALTNTLVKKKVSSYSSNSILFYNNALSSVFIAVFILIFGGFQTTSFHLEGMFLLFLSAFFSGFLGLLLFYEGLKHIRFSTANLIRSTGPLVVAFYSWWFFPIELTIQNIIGAILLLGSVILVTIKPKKIYGKRERFAS